MLCQKCGKNSANVKIVKNINGAVNEAFICSACAKDEEFNLGITKNNLFDNLFSNVFSPKLTGDLTCDFCKTTYRDFRASGKFGCAYCVDTFENYLDSLFKNVQGSITHTGKLPKKSAGEVRIKRELQELKHELRISIENEEFEKSAKLRDKIKELEKEAN